MMDYGLWIMDGASGAYQSPPTKHYSPFCPFDSFTLSPEPLTLVSIPQLCYFASMPKTPDTLVATPKAETRKLERILSGMQHQLDQSAAAWATEALHVYADSYRELGKAMRHIMMHHVEQMQQQGEAVAMADLRTLQVQMLNDLEDLLVEFNQRQIPQIREYLEVGVHRYLQALEQLVRKLPSRGQQRIDGEMLEARPGDDLRNSWQRLLLRRHSGKSRAVPVRELVQRQIELVYLPNLLSFFQALSLGGFETSKELGRMVNRSCEKLDRLEAGEPQCSPLELIHQTAEQVSEAHPSETDQALIDNIRRQIATQMERLAKDEERFNQLLRAGDYEAVLTVDGVEIATQAPPQGTGHAAQIAAARLA